ncbi:hypothetical protein EJ06DRAFT_455332, partial [Trichodelitschia bisporula]
YGRIREGDIVVLRPYNATSIQDGILTKPLAADGKIDHHGGTISHSSIIGLTPRETVQSTKRAVYRVFEPTLADYITLTPRCVTPIYPGDANLIVSLLDIHVTPPGTDDDPLEILEVGTGHGSLTLNLARAIHAANEPAPPLPAERPRRSTSDRGSADAPEVDAETVAAAEAFAAWKSRRRAVIHTLDVAAAHSRAAQKIVRGFRRGLYYGHVDFHISDLATLDAIPEVTQSSTPSPPEPRTDPTPFIAHATLDFPGSDAALPLISRTVCVGGRVVVFCPSVTQIVACVEAVRAQKLPLVLERVVELASGMSAGREWDVRAAPVR